MRTHRVAAVVPVIDEATAIGELTAGLRAAGACCVFVVDGGSQDGTTDVARDAGGTVIIEPRRGYGRACLTGASAATVDHPVVAFLDGDGSCDPADLPALVAALDDADLVLGARTSRATEAGALPWHARLGNMLVAALLRRRTGGRVRDLPPFKVIRREALAVLDLDDAGFGWTVQLVARALRAPGLRVTETPVRFRRRRGGRSKVSGSIRASYAAGRRMIGCALAETRRRPVIALMAKAPRAGHAKTRLAADIGQDAALGLWTACLADLGPAIRGAARGVADTIAVVPAAADAGPVAALLGPGWSTIVQQRSGLGGAITDGFVEAERLGADRAIAVSGDNPTLPAGLLLAALDALRRHGAVLGPSLDGGYHLVGVRLRRRAWRGLRFRSLRGRRAAAVGLAPVFETARLGGETALATTARALAQAGRPACQLEPWPDIDRAADLGHLAQTLAAASDDAPRTRAWLAANAALVPAPVDGAARPVLTVWQPRRWGGRNRSGRDVIPARRRATRASSPARDPGP